MIDKKIFDTTEGEKAWFARQSVFERIDNIKRSASTESDKIQATEDIKPLLFELRQLSSIVDLNGKRKKSGKENPELKLDAINDLDVALILKQYTEDSRPFFEYEEVPNLFSNKYLMYIEELKMKGIVSEGDTAEEFKLKEQEWIDNNTRTVVKSSFYEDRSRIVNRIKELITFLPDNIQEMLDTSQIYTDINDAIHPYKDRDSPTCRN